MNIFLEFKLLIDGPIDLVENKLLSKIWLNVDAVWRWLHPKNLCPCHTKLHIILIITFSIVCVRVSMHFVYGGSGHAFAYFTWFCVPKASILNHIKLHSVEGIEAKMKLTFESFRFYYLEKVERELFNCSYASQSVNMYDVVLTSLPSFLFYSR